MPCGRCGGTGACVSGRPRDTRLPAPFLQHVSVTEETAERSSYPFDLPWLGVEFRLRFRTPVTILTGENGTGNQR